MLKTTVTTLFCLLFLLHFDEIHAQNDHHSNHLLIKFKPSASYQDIQHLKSLYQADEIWISYPSAMRLWEVNFSSSNPFSNIHEVVQSAQGKPKVKSVGLDVIIDLDYIMNNPDYQMQTPDPTVFCEPMLYNLRPKSLPGSSLPDGHQVKIAFIDSGGPFTGTEAPNLLHGSYFDQVINLSDVGGDLFDWDEIPDDQNGHGIHTGGILALEKLLGPTVGMHLRFYRAFDENGDGSLGDVIRSIDMAVENGSKIISGSFGYVYPDGAVLYNNPPLREVIDVARTFNVLFVAAAGNDSEDNDLASRATYPASFDLDNIISVAAGDCEGNIADFSNHGETSVDLVAPGVEILSTYLGSTWAIKSGTSQAVPFVTYVAGLLASLETFDYEKVKCAILEGVDVYQDLSGSVYTSGKLDGPGALNAFLSECKSSFGDRGVRRWEQTNHGIQGVYPNPTTGDFQLLMDVQEAGQWNLQITTLTGQVIQEYQQRLDLGARTIDLHLPSDLPKGIYLLRINDPNGSTVKKIIKQ